MTYCLIQNGAITRYNVSKPTADNVSFGKNTTDAEYASHGWYKVTGAAPSIDPAKETVSGPTYSINEGTKTVEKVYTVTPKSLDDVKAEKLAALAAKRYEVEVGGTTLNGTPIDTDRATQSKLIAARIKAKEDPLYTVNWKMSGGFMTLDATTIITVADLVHDHVQAAFSNEAALSDAINNATTVSEVLAIDIETGW